MTKAPALITPENTLFAYINVLPAIERNHRFGDQFTAQDMALLATDFCIAILALEEML